MKFQFHLFISLLFILSFKLVFADEIKVIPHKELKSFKNNGNMITGIATPSLGSNDIEVWRSSIAVGSETPPHTHEVEEIFIVLRGDLLAEVEGENHICNAPCTLILPAGKQHIVRNIGDVPSDHMVILKANTNIENLQGDLLNLPWRE